jgi:hypothetical protein
MSALEQQKMVIDTSNTNSIVMDAMVTGTKTLESINKQTYGSIRAN